MTAATHTNKPKKAAARRKPVEVEEDDVDDEPPVERKPRASRSGSKRRSKA